MVYVVSGIFCSLGKNIYGTDSNLMFIKLSLIEVEYRHVTKLKRVLYHSRLCKISDLQQAI